MEARRACLLAAVLAAAFVVPHSRAQRCPEGTDLSSTEERGEELVVHCGRRLKGVAGATILLRESELGSRVLDFLAEKKIPVRVTDARLWSPESGAAFDFVKKELLLPPGALERPAESLAISIAHEGYHAIQFLERGMTPCIEAEQDAFFAQNVAYVEMARRGVRRLQPGDPLYGDFDFFRSMVSKGKLDRLDKAVSTAYGAMRRRVLLTSRGPVEAFAAFSLMQMGVQFYDFAFDLTANFETLKQRRGHPSYLWDKRPVKRTAEEHEKDDVWRREWVEKHRHELFRAF